MEHPIYCYQSTIYNYIPFFMGYQRLACSFSSSVQMLAEFNINFKNCLMDIVHYSDHIQIPTLKNLYEEVTFLMKDALLKTNHIQSIFSRAEGQINQNSIRLSSVYAEHKDYLVENSSQFEQLKNRLRSFQQSSKKLNQQIVSIIQNDKIQLLYRQIYKQRCLANGRQLTKLENECGIINNKVECLQENLQAQFDKNKRLFSVLTNQLEEVMVDTTLIQFSSIRQSYGSHPNPYNPYKPKLQLSLQQQCIQVEQNLQEKDCLFLQNVIKEKEHIESLIDKLDFN